MLTESGLRDLDGHRVGVGPLRQLSTVYATPAVRWIFYGNRGITRLSRGDWANTPKDGTRVSQLDRGVDRTAIVFHTEQYSHSH